MVTETVCRNWRRSARASRVLRRCFKSARLGTKRCGGEVADLDADGNLDFFLRSSRGSYFQVFSAEGDDAYRERAVITPLGEGTNQLGQRQVVGDFDGDGRGELIGGD